MFVLKAGPFLVAQSELEPLTPRLARRLGENVDDKKRMGAKEISWPGKSAP